MKKVTVIPAYEPTGTFVDYAAKLLKVTDALIVINDGSGREYDAVFERIGKLERTTVLSYSKNMGKGYALKKAFSYCLGNYMPEDIIITADCDGQYAVADVIAVCKAVMEHPEACVLGVRDFTHPDVPARRKKENKRTLRILRLLFSLELTDSQTGLRAFTVKNAKKFTEISGNRFEYETGMLIHAKRNHVPLREVPMQIIYSEKQENHMAHRKTFGDCFRTAFIMLRYLSGSMISGLLAAIADLGIFSLLTYVVFPVIAPVYTLIATVCSKITSSLINFFFNCKYVFHGKAKQSVGRFYLVWFLHLALSYANICLFGHVLGGHLTLMKLIGDCVLALLTYKLQCNWVYEESKEKEGFYGSYARFGKWLLRTFSRKYRNEITQSDEPVVYVCRHLNMHGPFTTLKWLNFDVHPMIIHMFFDRKKTVEHMKRYTFAERFGKKTKRFSLAAHVMGWVAPPMMQSLQGVPVYRNGTQSIATLKRGIQYLLRGESLIVYPDIDYTGGYDKPSEIYEGFLYMGELYHKKTGKTLRFIPLIVDDKKRQIRAGNPVVLYDYRREAHEAAEKIKQAINSL